MSEQLRTPAGSPNGGQFAEPAHAESSVELDDDNGLGWDGSFHAVPLFASAIQVFNFFTEHPPPDSTVFKLRRLANAKSEARAVARWQRDLAVRMSHWDLENPKPVESRRHKEAANAEHEARRECFQNELGEQMSNSRDYESLRMDPHSAYRAAIALGRWAAARELSEDQREALGGLPSGSSRSDGAQISIDDLVREHGLDEIADTVLDPESDQREMMELLREVRRIQGLTAHSSHQTAVALQDMAYYDDPRS